MLPPRFRCAAQSSVPVPSNKRKLQIAHMAIDSGLTKSPSRPRILHWACILTLDAPRLATVLDPLSGPPILRLFADHAH